MAPLNPTFIYSKTNEYQNLCFEQANEKYQSFFFIWKFSVLGGEIFYIFEKACFRYDIEVFY